ncbi:dihydropteroate synthase [Nigerium massiliense]|uniref:dihydropteroate synthase n=1 Tax=Nigerium massiliense TaxID=1522317 RepID=UPI00058F8737|nr:dihydropteroate synthase [Nigerium massiliense]
MSAASGAYRGRTLVMGVLNVTANSFSDGGRWLEHADALAHGLELVAQGADIVDVGGESTRPDSERVAEDVELSRVVPVVAELAARGVEVSVDTTRASVAAASLDAGATWINDVSGGLADPAMLGVVAERDGGYVSMHWRGHATEMGANAVYDDVLAEVLAELAQRRDEALASGIAPDKLVLDPGFGFAKTGEHNWTLLKHLDAFDALGYPLLIGVSRKRFLGTLLADGGEPRPAVERDDATLAVTTWVAERGAWAVRTHTVRPHRDAVAVVERLRREP